MAINRLFSIFLLHLTIFDENKPFWIIWEYFSSAHMGFSVTGNSGQNHKKADLSLKINLFQIFRSRFGLLVQFYPILEIKKYAQGQELLIFVSFFEKLAHCSWFKKFAFIKNSFAQIYIIKRTHINNQFNYLCVRKLYKW
jgi:hypothetical protein